MSNILSSILKLFHRRQTQIITYPGDENGQCAEMNYASTAEKYLSNPAVSKCVNIISTNLSVIPLKIIKDGKSLKKNQKDHISDLVNRPNPHQNKIAFFENIATNLILSGEAFIEIIRDKEDDFPLELNPLRPDKITLVLNKHFKPTAYDYFDGTESRVITMENMCHIKNFNPLSNRGASPMQSIMKIIDIYEAAIRHNYRLLENSGRPSGALVVDNKDSNLTEEQREKLRNDITKLYQGVENAGKIMLLEGPFKWVEMAISAKDFDYLNAISMSCTLIALAIGIPTPLLGGITQSQPTYSNYKEAKLSLFINTIIPMFKKIIYELNEKLFTDNMQYLFEIDDEYIDQNIKI